MSNITNCDSGSFSTENTGEDAVKQQSEILGQFHSPNSHASTTTNNSNGSNTNSQLPPPVKKKRSLPGNPDPSAEVIALSPNSLVATNRFICEICDKGFRRDQNLQLHRRGHNLPWKLKQRAGTEVRKRVYVCPEASCVHHNPARALGDLTGIKKHFSRKHGEKKWKCDKCSKKYAVQCDWKAHSKICGTKEYKCDCGTIFSRRDSFITHRAFCDALAEENKKVNEEDLSNMGNSNMQGQPIPNQVASSLPINTNLNPQIATSEFNNNSDRKHPLSSLPQTVLMTTSMPATRPFNNNMAGAVFTGSLSSSSSLPLQLSNSNMSEENGLHLAAGLPHMSATALLQKAAQLGATVSDNNTNGMITGKSFVTSMAPPSFGETQQQLYGIMNQYMHNGQQDFSSQYNFNANGMDGGSVGMSGLDMFNAILDQSKALSKIIEQNSRSSDSVFRSSSTINIVDGTKGSEDVMTLDLLGIGGGGGGGGGGGAHGDLYGGAQPSETDARDEIWRNWSNNNSGFESFSAT
ncbi:zinc finger protein GAI-ASSOCIATED FACTOR 1-like [Gastrolobium bilobum]|uniref:zinc finger protein GAI-ASSOCIATED FACTOR 1-like n=1 Tax=Gastrolobium bilobum TaxID=150636 RepID=UPI002AB3260E|nr:zinc finger protein GAI-ASSOCIATED FACTOR 1-like [Gastrolobium bilobum]